MKDILVNNEQEQYLNILKKVSIDKWAGYQLDKMLFNQIYYALIRRKTTLVATILAAIFFKRSQVIYKSENSELLLFSEYFKNREDHQNYWTRICNEFGKKDELQFVNLSKDNMIYLFEPKQILKKIRKLGRYSFFLRDVRNIMHRFYLSAQLVWYEELKQTIEELNIQAHVAMCFCDVLYHETFLVQYFKHKGIITVTNQHGQPIFRDCMKDRLNQSQIINFNSDYYIAKGMFTYQQFAKAQFDMSKIKVLGGYGENSIENDHKNNIFGVFLDFPYLPFAEESNKRMIKLANDISTTLHMKYLLKSHPVDHKNYEKYIGENAIKSNRSLTLKDIFSEIDFGIVNASAVYLDLLMNNIKPYRIWGNEDYPLVVSEKDICYSYEDFIDKYSNWMLLTEDEKRNYISSIKELYLMEKGFPSNMVRFIDKLLERK